MISGFQLVNHHIERLHLDSIGANNDLEKLSLGYFADYHYTKKDDGWSGEVVLGFRKDMPTNEQSKCLYEIVIKGNFKAQEDNMIQSDEAFVKYLRLNGATTLIPIARAALISTAALTGNSASGLYSLPNINVHDLHWQRDQ